MAGRGSRFSERGYETPKPLIELNGKPMVYYAWKSVEKIVSDKLIFIALKQHEELYKVSELLDRFIRTPFELIVIPEVTEGQLCTVLSAKGYFEESTSLLIAASDSYVKNNLHEVLPTTAADGIISTIDLPGEQWSFAKTNGTQKVVAVAEKNRISNHCSTGIYYFRNSLTFLAHSEKMIANNERTRGEFYIMPVYNHFLNDGAHIIINEAEAMWDMGTPEAKEKFENYLNESKI